MAQRRSVLLCKLGTLIAALGLLLPGCANEKAASSSSENFLVATTKPSPAIVEGPAKPVGFQPRHGDEIMVAGRYYRIGAPVVLWTDPGGYDAYRTEKRFGDFSTASWDATTQASPRYEDKSPARYNLRYNRTATTRYSEQELDQIRGGGWDLPLLQKTVDQFVLHYDDCGTSAYCFQVLQDDRFLSVHFMLDVDGTIYQTLDLKERAWHATRSNDRSIGIEIANMGAYPASNPKSVLDTWYTKTPDGKMMLTIPAKFLPRVRGAGPYFARRNDPIVGVIQHTNYRQFDYTPQQYDSLVKLSAALCDIFPDLKPDAPRDPDGKVINHTLTDDQWANFHGILGHYHIQDNKEDPGPAFDWDYFIPAVQKRLEEIRKVSPTK